MAIFVKERQLILLFLKDLIQFYLRIFYPVSPNKMPIAYCCIYRRCPQRLAKSSSFRHASTSTTIVRLKTSFPFMSLFLHIYFCRSNATGVRKTKLFKLQIFMKFHHVRLRVLLTSNFDDKFGGHRLNLPTKSQVQWEDDTARVNLELNEPDCRSRLNFEHWVSLPCFAGCQSSCSKLREAYIEVSDRDPNVDEPVFGATLYRHQQLPKIPRKEYENEWWTHPHPLHMIVVGHCQKSLKNYSAAKKSRSNESKTIAIVRYGATLLQNFSPCKTNCSGISDQRIRFLFGLPSRNPLRLPSSSEKMDFSRRQWSSEFCVIAK